jgi:light-independent protochlorophyllide reductase subunit B
MSHKGQKAPTDKLIEEEAAVPATVSEAFSWTNSGRAELGRIPFFVRGKVKRNTETFAQERGISEITDEVLYEAKAHFTR